MTFAFAAGSWIFLGCFVVGLLGVVFGYYTYWGSGIDSHPAKRRDDSRFQGAEQRRRQGPHV